MNKSLAIKRILYEYKKCVFEDIDIKIDINEKNVFIWNILMIPNHGFYKDIPLIFCTNDLWLRLCEAVFSINIFS